MGLPAIPKFVPKKPKSKILVNMLNDALNVAIMLVTVNSVDSAFPS